MFRRRTTDQVYATLQQVQRRITEGGAPAAGQPPAYGVRPTAPPPARYPSPLPVAREPGTATFSNPASAAGNPTPQPGTGSFTNAGLPPSPPPAVPAAQLQPPPPAGRFVLHIPASLASTLALVWLLTLLLAFMVGKSWGQNAVISASAPRPEQGESAPVAAEPARRSERWVIVLRSEPGATPEKRDNYRRGAASWNAWVRQNPDKGLQPWFDVREPANGHLELVYGRADGQLGIDREGGEAAFRMLASPKPNGGGFGAAKWVKAE